MGDNTKGTTETKPEPVMKADGTINYDAVPEGIRPVIKTLWESKDAAVKKANDLEATLKAFEEKRLDEELLATAKGFKNLGQPTDKLVATLKAAKTSMPKDQFDQFVTTLKSADATAAEAGKVLFEERGTNASGDVTNGSAYSRIEKAAKEVAEKSGGKTSFEGAIEQVMQSNPDLYREYVAEQRSASRN